jgi:hypothetical protein
MCSAALQGRLCPKSPMCGPAYVLGRLCRAQLMSQAVYVRRRLGAQSPMYGRLCAEVAAYVSPLCAAAYVLKPPLMC